MLLLSRFPYGFDADQFKLTREEMHCTYFLTQMQVEHGSLSDRENLFSPEEVPSCLARTIKFTSAAGFS